MAKINLKSIQNNYKTNDKINTEKQEINVKTIDNKENKDNNNKQLLNNDILKSIIDKSKNNISNDKSIIENDVKLSPNDRVKLESLITLYIHEFDKLSKYKQKNLTKMSDNQLVQFKNSLQHEIHSTNSLGLITEASKKLLYGYEFLMDQIGVKCKGISNQLSNNEEYNNTCKAVILKNIGETALISTVEPEYKLLFMIFQSTMMLHMSSELMENKQKINNINQNDNINESNDKIKDINDKYNILDA